MSSHYYSFILYVACLLTYVTATRELLLSRDVINNSGGMVTLKKLIDLCFLSDEDVRLLALPRCHIVEDSVFRWIHRRSMVALRAGKTATVTDSNTPDAKVVAWTAKKEVEADTALFVVGEACGRVESYHMAGWNTRGRAILMVLGSAVKARAELQYLSNRFKAVNVVAVSAGGDIIMCNPYSRECRTINLHKKNICDSIFSDKTRNLHGTTINVSMFHEIPHALALDKKNKTHFTGADPSLMNTIMKHLNAVPKIVPTNQNYGERLPNGTFTGSSGDIIYGRAELALNSRNLKTDRLHLLEYLYPHHQSDVHIFVPNSLPLPGYVTILLTLEPTCWMAVAATLPLAAIIWHIVRKCVVYEEVDSRKPCPSASVTFLHSLKVLLGDSLGKDPSPRAERTFYQSWLWFTLLLRTVFLGSFSSHLSVTHYAAPIASIQEWYDRDLKLAVFPAFFHLTIEYTGAGRTFLVNERMVLRKPNYVDTIIKYRNLSCMTRINKIQWEMRRRQHVSPEDDRPLLYVIPERLIMTHVQYEAQKNSPLVPRVNTLILRIVQAGLFNKWFGDALAAGTARGDLVPAAAGTATAAPPTALAVEHLQAAMLILGAGLAAAVCAFAAEQAALLRDLITSVRS